MADESSEQLREVVSLLQQLLEQQQKETARREEAAKSILGTNRPDWESDRKDHARRMEEIKREGEQRRQEDIAYREELLALLRQFSEMLPRLMRRLDEIDDNRR
jgi:hypothetical protein